MCRGEWPLAETGQGEIFANRRVEGLDGPAEGPVVLAAVLTAFPLAPSPFGNQLPGQAQAPETDGIDDELARGAGYMRKMPPGFE